MHCPPAALRPLHSVARLIGGGEGADHGAVIGALGAQIHFVDRRLPAAELVGVFGLQAAERGLRVGFAALRRHLHGIAAGGMRCVLACAIGAGAATDAVRMGARAAGAAGASGLSESGALLGADAVA